MFGLLLCFLLQVMSSVMSLLTATVRDPAFYRLHQLLDDLYNELKEQLPPYTREQVCVCVCVCHLRETAPRPSFLNIFFYMGLNLFAHGCERFCQQETNVFMSM